MNSWWGTHQRLHGTRGRGTVREAGCGCNVGHIEAKRDLGKHYQYNKDMDHQLLLFLIRVVSTSSKWLHGTTAACTVQYLTLSTF